MKLCTLNNDCSTCSMLALTIVLAPHITMYDLNYKNCHIWHEHYSKSFIKMFHLLFLQLCENVSIVILISPIYRSRIVQLRIHVDIVYTISSGSHGLRFSTRFTACSYQRLLTNLCRFESVQS